MSQMDTAMQAEVRTEEQIRLFEALRSRRSVRSYDPEATITREELVEIIQLATLAPSSANMQPWRFLVIDSPELKAKLHPIANNQQQVLDASATIAVLADMEGYRKAEQIYGKAVEAGYMPEATAKSFVERMTAIYGSLPNEALKQLVLIDGGLVSMQLMLAARSKGYDTVPMGGYDKAQFIEQFEVPENYVPVMLIALGKAAKPGHPTVRLPVEEVTFFNAFPR